MTVIKTVKPSKIPMMTRRIVDAMLNEYLGPIVVFILIVILSIGMAMHKSTCEKSDDVMPKYGCDVAGPKYLSEHKGVCVTVQKT